MNHNRTVRAVAVVTVAYIVVLAIWIGWLRDRTPPGTLPYQLAALVAGFGCALGLAMMFAGRGTAEQRRLEAHGVEGWATIEDARRIDANSTELHLQFTIPGAESFAGRIVYTIPPSESARFATGSIVPTAPETDLRREVAALRRRSPISLPPHSAGVHPRAGTVFATRSTHRRR